MTTMSYTPKAYDGIQSLYFGGVYTERVDRSSLKMKGKMSLHTLNLLPSWVEH